MLNDRLLCPTKTQGEFCEGSVAVRTVNRMHRRHSWSHEWWGPGNWHDSDISL